MREFVVLIYAQVVVQAVSIILLVEVFSLGTAGVIFSHFVAMLICSLIVVGKVMRRVKGEVINRLAVVELLRYGSRVVPHLVASWGMWSLSIVYAGHILGDEEVGQLVAINYLVVIANVASFAFFYSFQPWLYENLNNREPAGKVLSRVVAFLAIFCLGVFLLLRFSDFLFGVLFDSRYRLNHEIAATLMIACVLQFLGSMLTYFLYYFERYTKYLSLSTIAGAALNGICLYFWLDLKSGDISSVAVSFMLAQALMTGVRLFLVVIAMSGYLKMSMKT